MRTWPLVSAAALAVSLMPNGAKASNFLTVGKSVPALLNSVKVEPARAITIPAVGVGGGKSQLIILTLPEIKSGGQTVVNPIQQIIDQIFGKLPVTIGGGIIPVNATKPGTTAPKPTSGKDCDPKTGKPIETGHAGSANGHDNGHSGKDCDPKDKGHNQGHGGKDCDPKPGHGSQGNSTGNSGGTGNHGSSSQTPPSGDTDNNSGTGNGGTGTDSNGSGNGGSTGGGDTGTDTTLPPVNGDTGTGSLPDTGDTGTGGLPGTGDIDTGSGDIPGIGDDGGLPGDTNGGSGGTGTIPAGGIGGGPGIGGDTGTHIGDGGNQLPAAGAVPEPASWMTMIAGFGLVGSTMRAARKRGLTLA